MKKYIIILLISLSLVSCSPAAVIIEGILIRQVQDEQRKQGQELKDLQKKQKQLEEKINNVSVPIDP